MTRRHHHIGTMALLTIATIVALSAIAQADDERFGSPTNPEAQELLEEGNRHYRVQEFAEAVEIYKKGALIEDAPVFLYNLGQCYRQMGEYEKSIWHYQRFLDRQNPDKEVRGAIENFITQMTKELEQAARTEEPTEPGPDSAPDRSSGTNADGEIDESGDGLDDVDDDAAVAPWHADTVGWIITGAGVVSMAVGAGFFINASGLDGDADDEPDAMMRQDLRDKASSRRTWGTIATIAGGGLAVAGIVKLLIAPKAPKRSARGVEVSFGPSWVGVRGTF